jgi:hypothetical protein
MPLATANDLVILIEAESEALAHGDLFADVLIHKSLKLIQ